MKKKPSKQRAIALGWQCVEARDELLDYRRSINREINTRIRRLEKHINAISEHIRETRDPDSLLEIPEILKL